MTNSIKWHFRRGQKDIGKIGEVLASKYLERIGYIILAKNYKTKIGEIDIIAQDGKTLVFVEVKTRRSYAWGLPEEAIDYKKKRKLINLALLYIKNRHLYQKEARFDIISVVMTGLPAFSNIKLIKNAFLIEE